MLAGARGRRRAMERRLRELDRVDAHYGSGAIPPGRHPRQPSRPLTALPLVVTVVGVAALVLFTPVGPAGLRSAVHLGPTPLGHAPTVRGAGPYRWLQSQPHSTDPVAWDPCRPIHYRVDPSGGPADAVAMVNAAVTHASAATGLHFQYDGLTQERPRWEDPMAPRLLGGEPPVLIAWATAAEVHQLAGDVAGIGGGVASAQPDGRLRYVTGGVTLDADSYAELARRPNSSAEERAILLHELGHLVGLAHVHDRRELMNADNLGVLDYALGDRKGLAELGRGACF